MSNIKSLNIAGIPVIVSPPANLGNPAPLIILWHGFGIPANEKTLAKTLPLQEVQAWKAYPELPLFGQLMKTGNIEGSTVKTISGGCKISDVKERSHRPTADTLNIVIA